MGSSVGKLETISTHSNNIVNTSSNYVDDNVLDVDYLDDEPNSTCSNAYCWPDEDYENAIILHISPTPIEWVLIVAHFIVFTVGLLGNFLVCVAVFRSNPIQISSLHSHL